jgi:hypothetical protein
LLHSTETHRDSSQTLAWLTCTSRTRTNHPSKRALAFGLEVVVILFTVSLSPGFSSVRSWRTGGNSCGGLADNELVTSPSNFTAISVRLLRRTSTLKLPRQRVKGRRGTAGCRERNCAGERIPGVIIFTIPHLSEESVPILVTSQGSHHLIHSGTRPSSREG